MEFFAPPSSEVFVSVGAAVVVVALVAGLLVWWFAVRRRRGGPTAEQRRREELAAQARGVEEDLGPLPDAVHPAPASPSVHGGTSGDVAVAPGTAGTEGGAEREQTAPATGEPGGDVTAALGTAGAEGETGAEQTPPGTGEADTAGEQTPPSAGEAAVPELDVPEPPTSRLRRLRERLAGSKSALGRALLAVLSRDQLSAEDWDEFEETLLLADVGVAAAEEILGSVRAAMRVEGGTADAAATLRRVLLEAVATDAGRGVRDQGEGGDPGVILVVGVNGS
ncbi:MAG: signal recognition particle receptor subunit alpha, partial [Bifidobacteriaceae bacterium]|nr:signal recognition particle receptor subunit alpha [Bifidobacteriaceae bacterium]